MNESKIQIVLKLHKSIKPGGSKSKKIKVESSSKTGSSNDSNSNNNNVTHQGGADNIIDLVSSKDDNNDDDNNNDVLSKATIVTGTGTGTGTGDGTGIGATATASFGAAVCSVAGSKIANDTDKGNKNRTNPLCGCKNNLNTGKEEYISDGNTSTVCLGCYTYLLFFDSVNPHTLHTVK